MITAVAWSFQSGVQQGHEVGVTIVQGCDGAGL